MIVNLTESGLTERLATAVLSCEVRPLLHEREVRHALVDTLAVSMAASHEESIQRLRSVTLLEGSEVSSAWIPGAGATAGFLNGTAAHFFDFDDVSPTMPLHPSAVLVPALLAADERELTFERFAEAFNVGQATFRTIAQALPSALHYGRGWHSTSTVGRLAAVAALARLKRLDMRTTQTAFALASTMASGSRANFGTFAKPMHVGMSAQDALRAVEWAEAGITASLHELEAPSGYFARFGEAGAQTLTDLVLAVEDRFADWIEDWAFDWGLKRFPSCYGTHLAIDAVLDMRLDMADDTTLEIESIDVVVHENGTAPLQLKEPRTANEAKFSLEYCVALACINGTVTLEDFTPERFAVATDVLDLARKITLREGAAGSEFATVSMLTSVGRRPDATVYAARGDSSNPLSSEELRAKLESCFSFAGVSAANAARLIKGIDDLPADADVRAFAVGDESEG